MCSCRCWTSPDSSTPKSASCHSSRRGCGKDYLRDLDVAETPSALQDQVEGLTLGILDVRTDELPLRLQHHTIGVLSRWTRLLCMIA